jgi:hypothetical protein
MPPIASAGSFTEEPGAEGETGPPRPSSSTPTSRRQSRASTRIAGAAREPQRLTLNQSKHHGPFGKRLV